MKSTLFVIPGIFKREMFIDQLENELKHDGTEVILFRVSWFGKDTYEQSYETLKRKITEKRKMGRTVSLIGTSAGASFARKLYNDPDLGVSHLVMICGPVRDTQGFIFRIGKLISPTWKTSLHYSGAIQGDKNSRHVHTIIPRFDELVPLSVMKVQGAEEFHIGGVEHLFSISAATSRYAQTIAHMVRGA